MSVQIIYASTSGNVEWVMEEIAELSAQEGVAVELHRAEQTSPDLIQKHDHFVLATSTWEHGELNPFFGSLYAALAQLDCTGKQAAFLGLGDTRYEPVFFCRGIEFVRERWLEQGGQEVGNVLKINGEPFHQFDQLVVPWWQNQVPAWKGAP